MLRGCAGGHWACTAGPPEGPEALLATGGTSPMRATVASRRAGSGAASISLAPPTRRATPPLSSATSSVRSRMFCTRRYSGNRRGDRKTASLRLQGESKNPVEMEPVSGTRSGGTRGVPSATPIARSNKTVRLCQCRRLSRARFLTRSLRPHAVLPTVNIRVLRRVSACVLTTSTSISRRN